MERVVRFFEGWGVLMGVPALFVAAYVIPLIPALGRIQVCAVRGFLGCDCPGCGLIRSFSALVHGRIWQSIDFHPLGVVIAGWLVYLFARVAIGRVRGRPLPTLLGQGARDLVVFIFLAALAFQWAVKLWLAFS
jgi:hypothetical protein